MSEEDTVVTDEQVDKFFEEGGETEIVEPEVKQEVKEEVKEEIKAEEPPKMVPLPALHEERMKRKELQAKLAETERQTAEKMARLEERLNILTKQPEITYEEDPAQYLKSQQDQILAAQKAQAEYLTQQNQREQQQTASMQMQNHVASLEGEFVKVTPDYPDALNYVRGVREKELTAMGYHPNEVQEMMARDAWGIAQTALSREKNPAQVVYEIAQSLGYKKAEAKQESKLDTIEKGMQASKTVSGGKPPATLTLQALADMPDDEFNKLSESKWRELMGG